MATQQSGHETYYVPEQSSFPILATIGLFLTVFGLATLFNELTFGDGGGPGKYISLVGLVIFSVTLFYWFRQTIIENMQGLNSAQLKQSYVIGMCWFIFSEVMFFLAFFGALFYVRNLAGPWLGGEGDKGVTNMLWEGFSYQWPMMITPDQAANGASASMLGPDRSMSFADAPNKMMWLPMWNTIVLLASSVTVHFAHVGLKNGNRGQLKLWLAVTLILAAIFLCLQCLEYYEAYAHFGLTLQTGIYGSTFFMLTGFHGFHVCMGAFMLLVMYLRVLKGHFSKEDQFGFEAASWYWHFVDVVWVCLFFFVYIF